MERTCVVGLGSPHGDDRFGWLVAERISSEIGRRGMADVVVRRATSPAQLLDWLDGLERLLLVDACRGLVTPGRFLRLDWPAQELQQVRGGGSHDFTVWQTLELAARLGDLPPQCSLWCVPGLQFEAGAALTPDLLALVSRVADDVVYTLTN